MSFKAEPAMWISLIGAILGLAVAFGLKLTVEQTAAIQAVIQILTGIVTRSQVTPV
jgi:uncharacterized membrane protein